MAIDPVNHYGLSGYAGMMNNPTSYIDPDGRTPFLAALAIGATIGAFTGGVSSDLKGNGFLNGAWRGGITGGIGGGFGFFAPIGILPGLAFGAGGGAATGALGAALNGGNIGRGAMFGAIGGGVFGGISGGVGAKRLRADILTGRRASHPMYLTVENTISGTTPVEYGANSVKKLYQDNFQDLGMKGAFFTNKGSKLFPEENGSLIFNGEPALAVTHSKVWRGGKYHKIYFGKSAFTSKEQLALTLTHELGHVIHNNLGLQSLAAEKVFSGLLDNEGHVAIQKMTYELIQLNNWQGANLASQVSLFQLRRTPDSYNILSSSISHLIRKIR